MPEDSQMTVMEVLDRAAQAFGELPALKVKRGGKWVAMSWGAYRARVRRVARALIRLGVARGERICILGENSPRWFVAHLAAIHVGAIPAGIYPTSSPEQTGHILGHTDAVLVFAGSNADLERIRAVAASLPALRHQVLIAGEDASGLALSWDSLEALGAEVDESALEERIRAQRSGDFCELIYTSGTTTQPKGVMLSHDNLTWTARTMNRVAGADHHSRLLCYLPLCHIAEQLNSIFAPLDSGACVWFAEGLAKVAENLGEARPTLFVGVPRVWEKMQEKMEQRISRASSAERALFGWAQRVALAIHSPSAKSARAGWKIDWSRRLVFSRIRKRLGLDECQHLVSSAAPISGQTSRFFQGLDMPLNEIYGLSECTGPATASRAGCHRLGKVGQPLPGTELRVDADGEICVRGRNVFLGYFRDEPATGEALDADGWLHTGDVGALDEEGFLQITDRKKDILISAGGENVAPQMIEGQLRAIRAVSQAVVVGDRRKYFTALLTLDPTALPRELSRAGSQAGDAASAARCPIFRSYLARQVESINQKLARVQTIKDFAVLPRDFGVETGELTPTLKLKRNVICKRYAEEIDTLYANQPIRSRAEKR